MDIEFWKKRWQDGQTGWHASEYNKHLVDFFPRLGLSAGHKVLVPLCGKTDDMLFLVAQGLNVVGIEVSPRACRAFFSEAGLTWSEREDGEVLVFEGESVTLFCTDLFNLKPTDLPPVDACYDRACLIAMNGPQRVRYVRWLSHMLPSGGASLMLAVEYPSGEKNGPPFSVPNLEIDALYAGDFEYAELHREDILDSSPKYREWGVTQLIETAYLMTRT
jgi:thiopurine S-methyltransferase